MTITSLDRHIPFAQCCNFRDLGGYRTISGHSIRWRRLFRSAALHYMTPEDATVAREVLGIATVLDLRSEKELTEGGKGPLFDGPFRGLVQHLHLPLLQMRTITGGTAESIHQPAVEPVSPPTMSPEDAYYEIMRKGGPRIAAAIETLAAPGRYPAVFHCAAGKDRTGIVAAVVLGVLGVNDEDIVQDYALTNRHIHSIVQRARAMRNAPSEESMERYEVKPERIRTLLEKVRGEFGSVTGFVRANGIDASTIAKLRENLLA